MSSLPKRGDTRQQLIRLLEQARNGHMDGLTELLDSKQDSYSSLLYLLTQLEFDEAVARSHYFAIEHHYRELSSKLGRDVGFQLAALDYFQNVKCELRNPKIIELGTFLATERSAITDALTGLYNRQYFDSSLRRELKRSRRYGLAFSLVMLDLDDFKKVNDQHGHPVGDQALNACSNIIKASVREIDVACRYGGEEFSIILPETSRAGAYIVSERIRADIKELFETTQVGKARLELSVSGGVALYPTDANSVEELVEMADKALYSSKHHGKNQITLYADEKRRSPRFDAQKLLVFREREEGGGREELRSQTKNLSRSGALVESRVPLNVGTELEIGITVPQSQTHFDLKGRVVRLEEAPRGQDEPQHYNVGIAFVADTAAEAKEIESFASELYRPLEEEADLDRIV